SYEVVDKEGLRAWADTPEGRMLGLFDVLIQNPDRTGSNWRIDEHDNIYAIDHSDSFHGIAPSPKLNPFAVPYLKEDPRAPPDSPDETPSSARHMGDGRRGWQRVKPESARLGRSDWYDGMMRRLDALGSHVKGPEPYLVPEPGPREPLPR